MEKIEITEEAAHNILRLQQEYDAPGFGLRFGLRGGGCSGYKYVPLVVLNLHKTYARRQRP